MRGGSGGRASRDGSSSSGGSKADGSGGSSSVEGAGSQRAELPSNEAAQERQEQQEQQETDQEPQRPVFGQRWGSVASSSQRPPDQQAGDAEAAAGEQQQQQDGAAAGRPRGRRFAPPPFNIITGVGRHSKGDRGGVLKAAVKQVLQQQGLPTRDDPTNEGGWLHAMWRARCW